jgi:murein DD-endopeptidase MepM/ murein hydrolase activator NlpD
MNLKYPTATKAIAQTFGGNANNYYQGEGLKGHPGTDFAASWGDPITASHDAFVYKVLNIDNPDLSQYRAVLV